MLWRGGRCGSALERDYGVDHVAVVRVESGRRCQEVNVGMLNNKIHNVAWVRRFARLLYRRRAHVYVVAWQR